jgi:hypothetical protein
MIFAICGLTVDGTGTERAGTSSIGDAAVCAAAALNPAIPIAAHNSVVARSAGGTNLRIPAAGSVIAFPLFFFIRASTHRDDLCALDAPPATPSLPHYSRMKRLTRP